MKFINGFIFFSRFFLDFFFLIRKVYFIMCVYIKKERLIKKLKIFFCFFFFVPKIFLNILLQTYIIIIISVINFLYLPVTFIMYILKNIIIPLRIFIFLFLIFFIFFMVNLLVFDWSLNVLNTYKFIYDNIFLDIKDIHIWEDENLYEKQEFEYLKFLDFINLQNSFLRDVEIDKNMYYSFEFKKQFENKFLHKAFFGEFVYNKYLFHTTNIADWFQLELKYDRGWLNNTEIFNILHDFFYLEIIYYIREFFIFFVFEILPCDIIFIQFKYYILDNIVLSNFFHENIEVFFFRFFVIFFSDFFLLYIGFFYKYILIIIVDYIFDHFISFFFKFAKIIQIGPGNYVLKKKLLLLDTDTILHSYSQIFPFNVIYNLDPKGEKTFVYPFLEPYDPDFDDLRTNELWMFARSLTSNVVETTPIIYEHFDIQNQTGSEDPRIESAEEYNLYKTAYNLDIWDEWSDFNLFNDFFAKNYYSKYTLQKGTFFPGKSQKDLIFFAGDKSILASDLPKELGWQFKGPFSFGLLDMLFTNSINTLENTGPLKRVRRINVNTNRFIDTSEKYFDRNYDETSIDLVPQAFVKLDKIYEDSNKIFINGLTFKRKINYAYNYSYKYNYRAEYFAYLMDQLNNDIFIGGIFKDMIMTFWSSGMRYYTTNLFSWEGNFYFGNENYVAALPSGYKYKMFKQYSLRIWRFWYKHDFTLIPLILWKGKHHEMETTFLALPRFFSQPLGEEGTFGHRKKITSIVKQPEINLFNYVHGKNRSSVKHVEVRELFYKKLVKNLKNYNNLYNIYYPILRNSTLPLNATFMQGFYDYSGNYDIPAMQNYMINYDFVDIEIGGFVDFYDFWVNSLLDSTYISQEYGKMKLQMENLMPYYFFRRFEEEAYVISFSSIIINIFYFFKIFFNLHILFFYLIYSFFYYLIFFFNLYIFFF
jgi:hypothetical protein